MLKNTKLASILGESQAHTRPHERVSSLEVSQLQPGRSQPRRHFDEEALASLAESIRSKGILQPLVVRQTGKGYEIVMGERRWRAAQMAGLTSVPVVIRAFTDQEAAIVALVENLQRADLNTIDEIDGKINLIAQALDLRTEQVPARLTQLRRNPDPEQVAALEEVFRPLGEKWHSFAANKLHVLNYPEPLLEAMRRGMALTLAIRIARAPLDAQPGLIARAEAGATRKEIEQEIARLTKPMKAPPTPVKAVGKLLASKQMDTLPPDAAERVRLWVEQMPNDLRELLKIKK